MDRTKVFVSYSHQDDIWKDRLLRHMALLEFWGLLHVWVDTRIVIGEDWKRKIQEAMEDSQVALLLVSANFLTSKFIQSEELPRLFQLHSERGLQILPIMIRPCAWKLVPWLAQRQVRPLSGWPLSAGAEVQVDLDLAAITYEVAALIKRIDGTTAADQLDLAGSLNSRISWLSDNATHSTASVPAQPRDAAAIDDAYHALEIAAEELRGTSSWAMRDGILRLIEQAIRYGAPIYNAGSRLSM